MGAWAQLWPTLRNLTDTLERAGRSRAAAVLLGAQSSDLAPPVDGDDAALMADVEIRLRSSADADLGRAHTEGRALDGPGTLAFALDALADVTPG